MFVFVLCCESSGLCDELITRSEESYRVWCVELSESYKPREWDTLDLIWALQPQKKRVTSG